MLAVDGLQKLYGTTLTPFVVLRSFGLQLTHILNPVKASIFKQYWTEIIINTQNVKCHWTLHKSLRDTEKSVDHNWVFLLLLYGGFFTTCFSPKGPLQVTDISKISKKRHRVTGGLYLNDISFVQLISLC